MSAGYLAKCARKRRHPTREEAEKHRSSWIARGSWSAATSNTYRCGQCGCWHAGRVGAVTRGGRAKAKKNPVLYTQ